MMRVGVWALLSVLLMGRQASAVAGQVSGAAAGAQTSQPADAPAPSAAALTILEDSSAAFIDRFSAQAGKLRIVGVFAPG